MKCLKLYDKHDLRYEDTIIPQIDAQEVLVKVKSIGICRSDVHYFSHGEIGSLIIEDPIIPGHEFSGEVFEIGNKVKNIEAGDRVAIDPSVSCGVCEYCLKGHHNLCPYVKFCGTPPIQGALSEFYVSHPSQLYKLPDSLNYEDGALLEPLGVALHAAKLSKIKPGNKIAILGLGPIGLLLIQLIRSVYKNPVSGFDYLENRISFSKRYDPESSLVIHKNDYKNQSEFLSYESKFDIVFEAAGSEEAVDMAMFLSKPGGKVVLIGISPKENIIINSSQYRRKGLTLIGVRRMNNTYDEAISLVKNNKITFDGLVTHRFPLSMGASAFKLVENYRDGVIKAVFNI